MNNNINAVLTIALRDITKLLRDRARIAANFIFPIIFIGVLGSSMQANLADDLGYNFLTFVFIGVIAQTLFQSTAAGIISLVEDRQNDFAQEMFIAPISRYSIVLGKILGEIMVSMVQVFGVILFGLIFQVPLDGISLISLLPFGILVALMGGAFGLISMAGLSNQKTASQIFPFLLFPQFFIAGVFNPIKILPLPLMILSRVAPMTYAVDMLRSVYYQGKPEYMNTVLFNPFINLSVIVVFIVVFISVGTFIFVRNERNR